MAEFDEWLGVSGAAGSPREYREYLRASRWRQARPDAVKTVSNFCAGPKTGARDLGGLKTQYQADLQKAEAKVR